MAQFPRRHFAELMLKRCERLRCVDIAADDDGERLGDAARRVPHSCKDQLLKAGFRVFALCFGFCWGVSQFYHELIDQADQIARPSRPTDQIEAGQVIGARSTGHLARQQNIDDYTVGERAGLDDCR